MTDSLKEKKQGLSVEKGPSADVAAYPRSKSLTREQAWSREVNVCSDLVNPILSISFTRWNLRCVPLCS